MNFLPPVQIDPKALEALIVAARHGLRILAIEANGQTIAVISQSIVVAEDIINKSKEPQNAQAGSPEAAVSSGK